jgi:type IV secretory pathway VirJ component
MLTHYRRHALIIFVAVLVGLALLLYSRMPGQPQLERRMLVDGSPMILVTPGTAPLHQVLVAIPGEQALSDAQLLSLSQGGQARIGQFFLVANGDCTAQQLRLRAALAEFDATPDLLAGIGAGASLAWRWLAGQDDDKARALSVGFDLNDERCPTELPPKAAHGHWLAAWNDNPSDASARFARSQDNAETIIGDYDTPLTGVLDEQLHRLLQGNGNDIPVIEIPATEPGDTLTFFYSGDGGWRDLDRDVAAEMAKRGYPVVGIDSLRYFWQHKSPQQGAADLSSLMQRYRERWGSTRFVLIGYSFGADVLPAFYNRLSDDARRQISSIVLLAPARSASFEIEVGGWLGKDGQEAPTGPELLKLPAAKVLCVYGAQENAESGCTLPGMPGEKLQLPGGHHYDGDYPRLAERLLEAISQRYSLNQKN